MRFPLPRFNLRARHRPILFRITHISTPFNDILLLRFVELFRIPSFYLIRGPSETLCTGMILVVYGTLFFPACSAVQLSPRISTLPRFFITSRPLSFSAHSSGVL